MIGVIGSGAFGTALAVAQAVEGREVRLWGRDAGAMAEADRAREVPRLPGVPLPPSLRCTGALAELAGAEAVLLVLPAQATESFLSEAVDRLPRRAAGPLRQGDRRPHAPPADRDRRGARARAGPSRR